MFRGKLTQEGDLIEKGWKTIIFKTDDEEDKEIVEYQNQKNKIECLQKKTQNH